MGHFKKDCFQYKKWKAGKDKQDKANKVTQESQDSFCFMVKKGKESDEQKRILEETCFSVTSAQDNPNSWFVDSGATSHMSSSREFFTTFDPSIKGFVQLADNSKKSEVQGMGSSIIKCAVDGQVNEVKVQNVLYLPTFGSNLLSVKKLTKDGGFELSFKNDICKIIKEGKVLAYARLRKEMQDLYEIDVVVERACAAVVSHHKDNCQYVWHRRFGHRDPNAIKILAEKGLATGITLSNCGRREVCEYCVQGKLARKPFPHKNEIKTQAVLDLVHTDVCGPMQTTTPGKKRYTITIIDDFSRSTTIHYGDEG